MGPWTRGPSGVSGWGRDASWQGRPENYSRPPQRPVRSGAGGSVPSASSLVQQFMNLAGPNPQMRTDQYRGERLAADDYIKSTTGGLRDSGYFNPRDFGPTSGGSLINLLTQARGGRGGNRAGRLNYPMPDYKGLMSGIGNVQNDFSQKPDIRGLLQQLTGGFQQPQFQTSSGQDLLSLLRGAGTPRAFAQQQQPIDYGRIPQTQLTDFMSLPRAQYNYGI
jgi:hypothetical protein